MAGLCEYLLLPTSLSSAIQGPMFKKCVTIGGVLKGVFNCQYTLQKEGSKRELSPQDNPFWFKLEPFLVPGRPTICGKGSNWNQKTISAKGSPMGTAKEPFKDLNSTFFLSV